jgi:class 3 adenylate cyclase/pimeloyl-ACP methyl ester carboxylesterase
MAVVPETRYALLGDAHIAYQVIGEGPDLLFLPSTQHPIDLIWDEPTLAGHLHRLASFSRLILLDPLGTGSSDPVSLTGFPAMQAWTDGLVTVLDAAGSEQASVLGHAGAALAAIMLAASHPRRVHSLILWNAYARFLRAPDYPHGLPEEAFQKYIDNYVDFLGTGAFIDLAARSWTGDAAKRKWWATSERLCGGPGYFRAALNYWLRTDVRPVLKSIQAPTLIMRRRGDPAVRRGHALHLLEHIPQARLVEFDGQDHYWFVGDADPIIDEIESFLTGQRSARSSNRVLSTVLFTDIVESTKRAATLGDKDWSAVLSAHDRLVGRHVTGARGRIVKFTGDGTLATFDGPARAIECACAIRDAVEDLGLEIRAGLHTGEIEMADGDVRGIAVHVAARIMGLAGPGEVLVSGVMPPLVLGSRIAFDGRGSHELKGVPDTWPVFAVRS